jgi:hypothetical protein
MIHTDEDDEFDRIAHEAKMKGQPYYFDPSNGTISQDKNDSRFTPLGQVWPVDIKREWVGLTELEKAEITSLKWWDWEDTFDIDGFIKAIESKLKEKNCG